MPIAVQCPGCSARLKVGDDAAGQTISCPKCDTEMIVPEAEVEDAEVVEEQPRPRKKPANARLPKKRPADDDDDSPRREPERKSRVVLIAATGGVLIAGAAVLFFATREKEKVATDLGAPAGDGVPTRAVPTKSPAAGGFAGTTTVRNAYTVKFPWAAPEEEDFRAGPFADRPSYPRTLPAVELARIASAKRYDPPSKDNYEYAIARLKFRSTSTPEARQLAMDELQKQVFGWLKLTPGEPKAVTWGGKPAHEYTVVGVPVAASKPPQVVVRRLTTDAGGYLAFVRDHGELRPIDYALFFDSFELLHEAKSAAPPPTKTPDPIVKAPVEVPADWPRWAHPDMTFRVAFPSAAGPATQLDGILTKYKITAVFRAATAGGAIYHAGSYRYPDGATDDEKARTRDRVASALGAGIPVPPPQPIDPKGMNWMEYQRRTSPVGPASGYIRFREVGSTVHVVAARGVDFKSPAPEWEKFAASYELVK